jgi:hypothetical protein
MDGARDHVKQNTPDWENQISGVLSHMENQSLEINDRNVKIVLFGDVYKREGKRRGYRGWI